MRQHRCCEFHGARAQLWLAGLVPALAWALASGCAAAETPGEAAEPVLRLSDAPLLTLCEDNAEEEGCQLSRVRDVNRLRDGRFFIVDQPAVVQLFDSAGSHVGSFGGQGDGPGEFRAMAGPAPRPDGGVTTFDMRQFRLSLFDDQLAYVDGRRAFPSYDLSDLRMNASGVAFRLVGDGDSIGAPVEGAVRFVNALTGDSSRNVRFAARAERNPGSDMAPLRKPLQPRLFWDVSDANDVVVGYGDDTVLMVYDSTGTAVATLQRPWEPAAVTPEDIDSLRRAFRMPGGRVSADSSYNASVEPLLALIPDVHPRLHDALFSSTRDVWVQRGGRFNAAVQWDVFSYRGVYRGSLTLAPQHRLVRVRGDTAFVVRTDELGVPSVALYRVVGGSVSANGARN